MPTPLRFTLYPPGSRDWTQVSRIAGGFFISWATREVPDKTWNPQTYGVLSLMEDTEKEMAIKIHARESTGAV